ncbi:DUF5994 family protein [Amycolatopsis acidiphila]|uniref:DUF5994 family protein n=1 Tax=Amycolatopsis acidiphila TaxID=715473 RepID=UPI0016436E12|nr:DUF5994 family protein [Amycolatopsis acidiphila]UIJ63079.1 DUF5994 family protein [Amycolatopsis acidiphila]
MTATGRRDRLRLQMKPETAERGHVDGGWWPWSNDPGKEFAALVPALEARLGPVSRISCSLEAWEPAAGEFSVDGRVVRFEGFHSMDANTVVVIGSDSRRATLLVVPPDTVGGQARAALRAAAGSDSFAAVADILSSNGITPRAGGAAVARLVPEQTSEDRWESEGGRVAVPS